MGVMRTDGFQQQYNPFWKVHIHERNVNIKMRQTDFSFDLWIMFSLPNLWSVKFTFTFIRLADIFIQSGL